MKKEFEKEFDNIFWENKDMVFNIAKKYFNEHDSEDILQEVFIKIYVNYKKFRGESSIKTWIYRITLNEVYKRLKKLKGEKIAVNLLYSKDDFTIKLNELLDIIKNMPEKRAKVVILRGIDNLDFNTISNILQISEESARNLYSLGVKEMRDKLGIIKSKGVLYGEGLE